MLTRGFTCTGNGAGNVVSASCTHVHTHPYLETHGHTHAQVGRAPEHEVQSVQWMNKELFFPSQLPPRRCGHTCAHTHAHSVTHTYTHTFIVTYTHVITHSDPYTHGHMLTTRIYTHTCARTLTCHMHAHACSHALADPAARTPSPAAAGSVWGKPSGGNALLSGPGRSTQV